MPFAEMAAAESSNHPLTVGRARIRNALTRNECDPRTGTTHNHTAPTQPGGPRGTIYFVTVDVAPDLISAELAYGLLISEGLHARAGEDDRPYNYGMSMHKVAVPMA
ncbi:MAG: hypothetical protein ACI87O_002047 [Planctomycetota bacterium]|jgi:hypothetical protein